jgi:sugar fermentation stimulation protein A
MDFPSPLVRGRLIKRYKRFLADVTLDDGSTITASCANTGSMKGLTEPGSVVWLSTSDSETRKYKHTWEMIETDLGKGPVMVGINTSYPNKIVAEAIAAKKLAKLKGYPELRREVKYGKNSRIDILLEKPDAQSCYVEIKNVHLMRNSGLAEFPDGVTARGAKHLAELADMVREGHRAVMVYLVQRQDATRLSLARDFDPNYGEAYDAAMKAGVEAYAYRCRMSETGIVIDREIKMLG